MAGSYNSIIYLVDTETAKLEYKSNLATGGEMTGLYIPFKLAPDGTPAAVTDLEIADPTHDGNIEISFTIPTLTVDGKDIGLIKGWRIVCDDEILDVPFTTATPGSVAKVKATVSSGMHLFKVSLINETGEGSPANLRSFIGIDTPAAPTNITVAANGNNATISWQPVTIGANGGWIDASAVKYNVVRKPDDKVIATAIAATTINDEVETTNAYQYVITANAGVENSEAGASELVAIGNGMELPYNCSFANPEDFVLWTMVDANADGYTWTYASNYGNPAMLARSTYSYECDEWLITPPLKFEAGKEYKISYDAGAMNAYYPPTYTLALGTSAAPSELDAVFHTATVEDSYPAHSIIYLPEITESGTYYIGLHAKWGKGYPALYFNNVKIEENHAATLALTVTDKNGEPVTDALVTLGKNEYKSDSEGKVTAIEIEAGEYTLSIEKFGYIKYSTTETFTVNEHKVVNVALESIPTTTISGTVKLANGKPLDNAAVYACGYTDYMDITDANGNFKIENVYVTGNYSVEAHATNYLPAVVAINNITTSAIEIGDITLEEKLTAPSNITYKSDRSKVDLTWGAPVDRENVFRYDDGNCGMINSYEMSGNITNNTVTGVAYDTPAVYSGMSFRADVKGEIGIIIFALDDNGQPTTDILYEQTVTNEEYGWTEVTFTHPVIAPKGALFALRGNSRLYFDGNYDGSRNENYPVLSNKMWLSYDYTSAETPFHWMMNDGSSPLFGYNFLLRANGRQLGAPRKTLAKEAEDKAPVIGYYVWRFADGDEANQSAWIKLTNTPIADAIYTDSEWSTLSKGLYRYAVKAVYTGDEVSYATISETVARQMNSSVTITLLSNAEGESTAGIMALLVEKDGSHSYQATADENGVVYFPEVWEGSYVLTITCKGYSTLSEGITVHGETDFTGSFTLIENISKPENIVAEETDDATTRLLRWNFKDFIFDDFEGYDDFTVNPTGDIEWSYIDADGITDVAGPSTIYPDITSSAFVVLNPATSEESSYTKTHSGNRAIFSLTSYNTHTPTDDYIVSPELNFKSDFVVNFWVYTYWTGNDYIRVGYSNGGNKLEDFTWIGDPTPVPDDSWYNPTFYIPSSAKYVAINYANTNRMGGIDDIYIGPADKIPGVTTAAMPEKNMRVPGKAISYEVYLNKEKVGETTDNEWLLKDLQPGEHQAGVKSVFASGASEMAIVNFSVNTSGMVENIAGRISITAENGRITVEGVDEFDEVIVCDIAGRTYAVSHQADVTIAEGLSVGSVYIVRINGNANRILLR